MSTSDKFLYMYTLTARSLAKVGVMIIVNHFISTIGRFAMALHCKPTPFAN